MVREKKRFQNIENPFGDANRDGWNYGENVYWKFSIWKTDGGKKVGDSWQSVSEAKITVAIETVTANWVKCAHNENKSINFFFGLIHINEPNHKQSSFTIVRHITECSLFSFVYFIDVVAKEFMRIFAFPFICLRHFLLSSPSYLFYFNRMTITYNA